MTTICQSLIRLATPAAPSKPLPALRKGLTAIAVDSADLLHPVKAAITQALLTRSQALPVPMPKVNVVREAIVGSRRYIDRFKAQELDRETVKGAASYAPAYWPSSLPIDWTGPGGLMLVEQYLGGQTEAALVLMQNGGIRSSGLPLEGLFSMQRKARLAKSHIVLVTEMDPTDRATCRRMTDEFFVVSKCECDPDWDDAFMLDCVELSEVPALGQGKVMCNFRLTDRGHEFGFAPFVSENLDVRLEAILKSRGMTLKDIGTLMDKDKSNVCRDLKSVPLLQKAAFNKDDLSRWLECCGHGSQHIQDTMVTFEEFEKSTVVAQSGQEIRNDHNERNAARKPR